MHALLLLAALSGAAGPPACATPIDKAVSDMEMQGATFEGIKDVPGEPWFDQIVKFTNPAGQRIVGYAKRGCIISEPVKIDPSLLPDKGA